MDGKNQNTPTAAQVKEQIIAEYIDMNSVTCDCCQHVMIDVTAAKTGVEGHCISGDPEGEGSGCAWGWAETAENRQSTINTAAQVIAAAKVALLDAEDQLVALCSRGDVPQSVRPAIDLCDKWEAGR